MLDATKNTVRVVGYSWNVLLIVVKNILIEGDALLVSNFKSVLFNKLYTNIRYTSTFFPTRTYMDGFPKQTALLSHISSVYNTP
jgi:hypothetical protein